AFCPTPAPATIRYGVPLVTRENPATRSTMGDREVADGRFASTRQNRTAGKALRAARLAAGTEGAAPTQTEFAARLGDGLGLEISAAALSNWESGRRSVPSAVLLQAVAVSGGVCRCLAGQGPRQGRRRHVSRRGGRRSRSRRPCRASDGAGPRDLRARQD